MKIKMLPIILEKIFDSMQNITGKKLKYKIYQGIDASTFPDDVDKVIGEDRNGLYVFSSKKDSVIHYVGISNDIVNRFYQHIGKDFTWDRNGQIARFPHCALIEGRHWLDNNIKILFENAEFMVTFIIPEEKECKELIEKFLIYYGWSTGEKVSINVML